MIPLLASGGRRHSIIGAEGLLVSNSPRFPAKVPAARIPSVFIAIALIIPLKFLGPSASFVAASIAAVVVLFFLPLRVKTVLTGHSPFLCKSKIAMTASWPAKKVFASRGLKSKL